MQIDPMVLRQGLRILGMTLTTVAAAVTNDLARDIMIGLGAMLVGLAQRGPGHIDRQNQEQVMQAARESVRPPPAP